VRVRLNQIRPVEDGARFSNDDIDVNHLIIAMLEGERIPPIKICFSHEWSQVVLSRGQPVRGMVRTRKKYAIVNGHHRYAAARALGLETLPVEICKQMFSRNKKGVRYL
jgi:hypothetical protein